MDYSRSWIEGEKNLPSDSPKKTKTIDGIKKKFAKILENRYQKKCRVEISYRYEKIYKELKWNWEDLGLLIGDIIDELTGLKNPSILINEALL